MVQVTYRYYQGLLSLLDENYNKVGFRSRPVMHLIPFQAETELTFAFENCHYLSPRNQEYVIHIIFNPINHSSLELCRRILTFLIPLRMMKGSFPSSDLLSRFPALQGLYGRFIQSIKQGSVVEFDKALTDLEMRLVQLNIWLLIVKVREITVSRVFKKWYVDRYFFASLN